MARVKKYTWPAVIVQTISDLTQGRSINMYHVIHITGKELQLQQIKIYFGLFNNAVNSSVYTASSGRTRREKCIEKNVEKILSQDKWSPNRD
jgi:hypothetical protein